MRITFKRILLPLALAITLLLLVALPAGAVVPAQDGDGEDDLVERGRYLTTIAGCIGCHTPLDLETFQPVAGMEFAGGYAFPLPSGQVVITKNLTSDEATGLGEWTDEEIKTAISTGISRDGLHLFPIMPYVLFNNMAEEDLDAIVAFLRTLPPINNPIPREQIVPPELLPHLERRTDIVAPDPSDTDARGNYLLTSVIACTDCHTAIDPETGAPIMDQYLAGGQPFEGPWGIVYGGNITPDEETGIGTWSDEDIARVLSAGVRPDGRVVVVMPWQEYTVLTDEDRAAVINYLRNDVAPVNNEVPAAALNEEWIRTVELPTPVPEGIQLPAACQGGAGALILGLGIVVARRRKIASK